jgi:FkbM family methyltransferase
MKSGTNADIEIPRRMPLSARAYRSGRAAADRLGLRRTARGRKALAALNIVGGWAAGHILSRSREPLAVAGLRLHLAGRRAPSLSLATAVAEGGYERATREWIETLLREGGTFFDVGAHVGFYSLVAARRVGERGRVYAFEPEPDNFRLLGENIAENGFGNVVAISAAVCDRPGRGEMYVSWQGNDRHSLFRNPGSPIAERRVAVETTTLDAFAEALGWPAIDLVKMDIEGAEPLALAGMGKVIRRSPKLRMIVEFSPGMLEAGGERPERFLETLAGHGFDLFVIEDDGCLAPLSRPQFGAWTRRIRERGVANLFCQKSGSERHSRSNTDGSGRDGRR